MLSMSNEDLARLLQNLIRSGNIFAVDYADPPRVRVKTGDNETDWRPWIETRAGRSRTWDPPTIGEQVILFSPGGDLSKAFILPSINSDEYPSPSRSPDETVRTYPDGARVSYNHKTGAFVVTGIKTMLVDASENITLKAPSIDLDAEQTTSTGKHTIKGLLSYLAGLAGLNGTAGTTKIVGSFEQEGGNLSSNGVVLDKHDHGGVIKGGDRTEGPTK